MRDTIYPKPLTAGLAVHCASCSIVVPTDAPTPSNGDCGAVEAAHLAWHDPYETVAAQHAMAVGAWGFIYHVALSSGDSQSLAYRKQFLSDRKGHFALSAARQAMTEEQVEADSKPRAIRCDAWLHKP